MPEADGRFLPSYTRVVVVVIAVFLLVVHTCSSGRCCQGLVFGFWFWVFGIGFGSAKKLNFFGMKTFLVFAFGDLYWCLVFG